MNEIWLMRWVGRLLTALRLSPFVDALDHFFARQRGHLSRFVPEGAGPRRYP
jgi:hypothetical protein